MSLAGTDVVFRAGLEIGEIRIQRCTSCKQHIFFPRAICPHCGGQDIGWVNASGGGQVYSTTVVHRKVERGGDYNVALIDLDEGVRMMSRVEGVAPDQVRIGMRVSAYVGDVSGAPGVLFQQAEV